MQEIPDTMEELFLAWGPAPDPGQWPEYLREDPVRGYGLFCLARALFPRLIAGFQCQTRGDDNGLSHGN